MRIKVDRDLCEANALCVEACPEVFELSDDDELIIRIESPDESLRAAVETAVMNCPRQALDLED